MLNSIPFEWENKINFFFSRFFIIFSFLFIFIPLSLSKLYIIVVVYRLFISVRVRVRTIYIEGFVVVVVGIELNFFAIYSKKRYKNERCNDIIYINIYREIMVFMVFTLLLIIHNVWNQFFLVFYFLFFIFLHHYYY